jgi:PAS domain S-box-containing protein
MPDQEDALKPDVPVVKIDLATAAMLQRLIDLIGTPILVKDSQHRWVLVNEAMEKMDGRRRQDVLGKTDFDLLPRPHGGDE